MESGGSRPPDPPRHQPGREGTLPDPLATPYREREKSITIDRVAHGEDGDRLAPENELFTINLGPHHPATHGVLRLLCTLEGEVVRELKPIIGYVHTGIEKGARAGGPARGAGGRL